MVERWRRAPDHEFKSYTRAPYGSEITSVGGRPDRHMWPTSVPNATVFRNWLPYEPRAWVRSAAGPDARKRRRISCVRNLELFSDNKEGMNSGWTKRGEIGVDLSRVCVRREENLRIKMD